MKYNKDKKTVNLDTEEAYVIYETEHLCKILLNDIPQDTVILENDIFLMEDHLENIYNLLHKILKKS